MNADLPLNALKERSANGELQLGMWAALASSYTVEVIAGAGYDWALIDTEHSPTGLETVLTQLQALAAYDTAAVVRVPSNDTVAIKRCLDIGTLSLLIPYVETAEDARQAVASTRYPPVGVRGVAMTTRASRFGRVPEYSVRAADQICVMVQIESRQGMENIEEIAKVEGVDVLFIGPADLHASLGHPGETSNTEVLPLIDDAIERIVAAGKTAGVFAPVERLALRWIERGALLVAVGSDIGVLARGSERLLDGFRELTG